MPKHFARFQTRWQTRPAAIGVVADRESITLAVTSAVCLDHKSPVFLRMPQAGKIQLYPHEAKALAAWLDSEASKMLAREAKREARNAARRAARQREQEG